MSNAKPLSNAKRCENYIRQNLGEKGTPMLSSRQERRLRRHDNLAKIRQVANATFGEPTIVPPTTPVVELPEEGKKTRPCGGTDHCVTPKGAEAKNTHKKCESF